MLRDDKQTYQYDAFNRTTQVDTFEGNVQINRYDAENLRHEIVENGNLASFIFSHGEVVVETNTTDTIRLIRGYDIIASDSEKAKTYYHYASDELGSTTHIFEGNQLRNRYEYDAFGNIISQEETIHNRFKYTGQQHDPITQQYYLRARFYNPVIARFTQEDVYRGDGLNLYAYCRNNPVRYYDPSGYALCDKSLHDRLIAKGWDEDRATQVAIDYAAARNAGISAADAYKQATGKNPLKDNTGSTALVPYDPHFASSQKVREETVYYNSSTKKWCENGRYAHTPDFAQKPKSQEPNDMARKSGTDDGIKRMNAWDSGHHVPAVRKSQGRAFEVSRSDKSRPTLFFNGDDPGYEHWRLHDAEKGSIGKRQGDFKGSNDELFEAYRRAYEGLEDISVDVISPDGTYVLGRGVTPKQAVDLIQEWLKNNDLY